MGRSKPTPKRRKVDHDQHEEEAIAVLMSVPDNEVEEAAAQATRKMISTWPKLTCSAGNDPEAFQGLGHVTIEKEHFEKLVELHRLITSKVPAWTSWSGSTSDPRRRAFGFLPGTLGHDRNITSRLDISTPWQSDDKAENERPRNERAIVTLDSSDLPDSLDNALDALTRQLSPFVPATLQPVLNRKYLIAAQPNLHSGRKLLPAHVDHPLKDGFGVIIVTIAIEGNADVFLTHKSSKKGEQGGTLSVPAGSAYVLSGNVRNESIHGVLADNDSSNRESLNLRFGLHDYEHCIPANGDPEPQKLFIPSSDVLKHFD